jgi:hypothetical protein
MQTPFDWNSFSEFGLAGMVLFVLLLVVFMHQRAFRDMSTQWRESFEAQAERADSRQAETNEVLRNMTRVISEK